MNNTKILELVALDPEYLKKSKGNTRSIINHYAKKHGVKVDRDTASKMASESRHLHIEKKYFYHKGRQIYIVVTREGVVIFDKETHDNLLLDYSDYGGKGDKQKDIALTYDLTPIQTADYIKAFGLTHDSLPISDEDSDLMDESDISELLVKKRRIKMKKAALKAERQIEKRLAEKWEDFDNNVNKPLIEAVKTMSISNLRLANMQPISRQDTAVVFHLQDLHFGKGDVSLTKYRVKQSLRDLKCRFEKYGNPDTIITQIGGDFFNSDNIKDTTTKGTQQQSDIPYHKMVKDGYTFFYQIVDYLRELCNNVVLVSCQGNHDTELSLGLVMAAEQRYYECSDVSVVGYESPFNVVEWGDNLLCFFHGHSRVKDKVNLGETFARLFPDAWFRSKYRYFHTAHHHLQYTRNVLGGVEHHANSLSQDDDYHILQGFVGNPIFMTAQVYHSKYGQESTYWLGRE